ncbi:Longitudinals lacking protein, isoforms A/B/D/L [Zootermopsis nevadensis]|uniref:Longitudinals lacking protein, isoforms A/B/D/L n=1 Tax=Zootermopsis nevadensis TaxID=136037 RepID=A0A067RMI0_ZOONE|nr:Longitudinals lacking protein, isoforms A/B/D/L [Zootermopsis nevadensis]
METMNIPYLPNTLVQQQSNMRGPGEFPCPQCFKIYKYKRSMIAHLKIECGKEPQLSCPYCPHRSKKNHHLAVHIRAIHKDII